MRKPLTINSRSSTLTNAFVQAILPFVQPSDDERQRALAFLGQEEGDLRCVYCGDGATDWDHLRPLVSNGRPSGYLSVIGNMVPACARCNQSKSGSPWRDWMLGAARLSPTTRQVPNLDRKFALIEAYERAFPQTQVDMRAIVGAERWDAYWQRLDAIHAAMRGAQSEAETLRESLESAVSNTTKP